MQIPKRGGEADVEKEFLSDAADSDYRSNRYDSTYCKSVLAARLVPEQLA